MLSNDISRFGTNDRKYLVMVPLLPLSFEAGGGLSPWTFVIDKINIIAISILEVGANDRIA